MSEELYLVTILLIAGTCLAVFVLKFLSTRSIEKAKASKEDDYRNLAAKAVSTEAEVVSKLSNLLEELAELKTRIGKIEQILSQVG
jgi:hypothetical protein